MLGPQRRREIVELVERHGVVRISEVARDFEVSRKTALRDLGLLDAQGLVDKVHGGAIAIVGPAAGAASEASQDDSVTSVPADPSPATTALTGVSSAEGLRIGIVLPSRSHHNRAILRGAETVLTTRGAAFDVSTTGWIQPDDLAPHVAAAVESNVHGLLLRPAPATGERRSGAHDWLEDLPIPGILVEDELQPGEKLPIWSVATDDERGVAVAIDHLRGLGHRRIGLVTVSDAPRSQTLQRLWRGNLRSSGLDQDVPVIDGADFDNWPLPDPAALTEILQTFRSARVTALLCHSDVPAHALIDHAAQVGLSIPGDLSVVAYEDRISTRATTPITTVVLPGYEVGRVAAESMLDLLHDPGRPPRRIRIAPELVLRRTSGQARDAG